MPAFPARRAAMSIPPVSTVWAPIKCMWRVRNGEWRVENDEWEVASGEWRPSGTTLHSPRLTHHSLQLPPPYDDGRRGGRGGGALDPGHREAPPVERHARRLGTRVGRGG